ncbi:MAG TPA: DUF222 domain-containing protein, partial [Streptosporangiaceae bacterium]|nr:DUF222 domain-containing protein [Streptosporangiaceae bacterium]
MFSWTDDFPLEDVLAAAQRLVRDRAGHNLPATDAPGPDAPGPEATGADATGADASGADATGPEATSPETTGPETTSPEATSAALADEDPLGEADGQPLEAAGHPVLSIGELAGQARLAPGPALAGWLGCAPAGQLDDAGLVSSLAGWRKITSWAQAQELAGVAELARRRGVSSGAGPYRTLDKQDPADFAPDELALALTLTQCSANYWMGLAVSLSGRLPRTLAALAAGTIDLARAKVIDEYTTVLDDDVARKVEDKVLARAGQQTTGQLCASLRRAVISVDPAAAERRRKQAERHARVELVGEPDGTASLLGRFLPAAQASAAWTRINAIAAALRDGGAPGGIDLLRAQVLIRLILGVPPSGPPPAGPGSPGSGDRPAGDPAPEAHGSGGSAPEAHRSGSSAAGGRGPGGSAAGGHGPGGSARGDRGPGGHPAGGPSPDCPSAGRPARQCGAWNPLESSWPRITSLDSPPGPWFEDMAERSWAAGDALKARAMLMVPLRTLAGSSGEPGQLSRIGPVTPAVAHELAGAAAADATCEWRVIVAGPRGQPLVVTRIRSPGCGPAGQPGRDGPPGQVGLGLLGRVIVIVPAGLLDPRYPASARDQGAGHLAGVIRAVLRAGQGAMDSEAAVDKARACPGPCGHEHSVPGYRIPGRLRAFIEARDHDCGYPV